MKNYKLTKSDIKEISKKVTSVIGRKFGASYDFNVNGDGLPLRYSYGSTIESLTSDYCDKMEIKIIPYGGLDHDYDDDYEYCEVERVDGNWIVT